MSLAHTLLAGAVFGLLVGPILSRVAGGTKTWRAILDGFLVIAVGGLAALHLLPEAMKAGGPIAIVLAIVGVATPGLWERISGRVPKGFETIFLLGGLAVHAALESAALAPGSGSHHEEALGAAVIFHRIPVGLMVFTLMKSWHGRRGAWLGIAVMVAATVGGFFFGAGSAHIISATHGAWLQAFVAGSLLHVVIADHAHASHDHGHADKDHAPHDQAHDGHAHDGHAHDDHAHDDHAHDDHAHDDDHGSHGDDHGSHDHGPNRPFGAVGGMIGVAVVAVVLGADGHHEAARVGHDSLMDTLMALTLESAPALLIAYVLAGLSGLLLTPARVQWLSRGAAPSQALRGVAFGLPLPICSCGVLPVYESLVRKGVPATAALSFLVATPELGIDAMLISLPLLGTQLTIARLVAAFGVAVLTSLLVGRLVTPNSTPPVEEAAPKPATLASKVKAGLHYGFVELFDHTMPWVMAGLIIAAIMEPLFGHAGLLGLPKAAQVPLFALVGIPMYVCATGATPIAAIAIHQGISPGAALAFLLAGPATNITTFGILSKLHDRRVAAAMGLVVTGAAIGAGFIVDSLALETLVDLTSAHDHQATLLQKLALVGLGLLSCASLFRQGPRGMVRQLTNPITAH